MSQYATRKTLDKIIRKDERALLEAIHRKLQALISKGDNIEDYIYNHFQKEFYTYCEDPSLIPSDYRPPKTVNPYNYFKMIKNKELKKTKPELTFSERTERCHTLWHQLSQKDKSEWKRKTQQQTKA